MFNVCPNCGEYRPDKEIDAEHSRAICPECGYAHPFQMLPLFVVTGASGTGKSTACLKLASRSNSFVVMEVDILWRDEFNDPGKYLAFRDLCLRVSKNISQAGRPVVLFGSALPSQYQACIESRYFSKIHYLALTCDPSELSQRLRKRPEWRNSGTEDNIDAHVEFNRWFIDNYASENIRVIDTTAISVDETVGAITSWVEAHI